MENRLITPQKINEYIQIMLEEDKSRGTIEKYTRDLNAFFRWNNNRIICKEITISWKEYLLSRGYAPITVNSMLASLNGFFRFMEWNDLKIKFLKIQRKIFREQSKELTQPEYDKLINTAIGLHKDRLAMIMETICSCGIRVSEVKYITVEAIKSGKANISLKSKIRTILLPKKLCTKLIKYAKNKKIASGEIFITESGKGISRKQIWSEMKKLCDLCKIEKSKVFPHNLRHLFATTFHRIHRDIVKLADILGHSNIDTTRIYLATSGSEYQKQLDRLNLVL